MPYQRPTIVGSDRSGFSSEDVKELHEYIRKMVRAYESNLESFRTGKLEQWVKVYKGIPKSEEVNFPWPGAANLVIQLVGTFCDELLSRIMGALYQYDPLFSVQMLGDSPDKKGEDKKAVLEKFLMDEAYDPKALDFYRVEQAFLNSAIKYGTGVMEFPWEYEVEQNYVSIGGFDSNEFSFNEIVKRDAPHPKLVPLNKFGVDPSVPVLADQDFFYTKETLKYTQVKNLPSRGDLYKDKETEIQKILGFPDRTGPDYMQQQVQELQGVYGTNSWNAGAEWDLYNCYIKYRKGDKTYSLIAKYHKHSDTLLWAIFNIYTDNMFPVEDVKLSYDDESYFGTGYAQMLRVYQQELSQNSNWRTNNRNFAMLGMLRIDPDSKLSSVLQIYPGVAIPAKDQAVELIKPGTDVGYSSEPDSFIMSCAKERAGVDPAIGGTGGGLVNNKRGIYSASGTSMMLIQQNNRNNLRMSDMRSAHVRIATKLLTMYANIGIGKRIKKYGDQADILLKAFEDFKNNTLGFRLRPTTASNNKELERQNDILLASALERFYQSNAQMIQAATQAAQQMPQLAKYYQEAILGNTALFKQILRNFNHDNIMRLIPEPPQLAGPDNSQQGGGANGSGSAFNTLSPGSQGIVPTGGLPGFGAIPQ